MNREAGSLIGQDADQVTADCADAFRELGWQVESADAVAPQELQGAIERAIEDEPDILIVGGGDGTVRSAAAALAGRQTALGILPLGTLNRMARDLNIPLEPLEAAEALAAGEVQAIDVGEVNGITFLCNCLMGLPTTVATERQRLRGARPGTRIVGYFDLIRSIALSTRRLHLELDDGGRSRPVRALSLAVSNNRYAEEPSVMLRRARLDAGELAIYVSHHRSGTRMAFAMLRAMCGRWRGDPDLVLLSAKRVMLKSRHRRLRVSVDGEVETLSTPITFESHAGALRVLAPAAPSEGDQSGDHGTQEALRQAAPRPDTTHEAE